MNLVMCNMSNAQDWDSGIVNRNFFIARELIASKRFERVMLVDFLAINPIGLVFGKRRTTLYAWRSLIRANGGTLMKRYGARHVLVRRADGALVFSGIGRSSTVVEDLRHLQQALSDQGFVAAQTLLWSYNAFEPRLLDIPAAYRVFDAVDDWSQHASYGAYADRLRQNYRLIGDKADAIFTVSDGLRSLFPSEKTQWVPNGVDIQSFANRAPLPDDIASLPRPLIGYVGTVQERIDFDLLQAVCSALPRAQFVFIGPVWSGVQGRVDELMRRCPNVRFLGRRAYSQVPQYMQALDAAIIPHRLDAFIESTNPMKMYEYLAAGKPVITTPGAGTDAFKQVISIVRTAPEFVAAINDALAKASDQTAKARRAAVAPHTWRARAEQMQQALKHAMV